MESARKFKIFQDFSGFFKIFQDFSTFLLRFFKMFQDFSKFFKIFQDFLPCWRKFVVATSEQVQILVYLPGRSGLSTRAVGPGTNFGGFPRSLGA